MSTSIINIQPTLSDSLLLIWTFLEPMKEIKLPHELHLACE